MALWFQSRRFAERCGNPIEEIHVVQLKVWSEYYAERGVLWRGEPFICVVPLGLQNYDNDISAIEQESVIENLSPAWSHQLHSRSTMKPMVRI